MNFVRAGVSLAATAVIAGWVAYAVSAPRNLDNVMNEPMAALGGSSIAAEMDKAKTEAREQQCAKFQDLARDAWDRSLENDTSGRDAAEIDHLDRQVERFCS